jgi:UDP-N-acetylmuramoylalanine--D-glutamate ligase
VTPGGRAVVQGLGLFGGGVGVTRHLLAQGWSVTVTDLRDAKTLAPSVAALEGLPVALRLGGHDLADFAGADLVVVNPAVPPGNPFVKAAIERGAKLDTEIGMFVRSCRGRTAAVTGSAGKSTTTALLARCLEGGDRAASGRRVFLGGNIGVSLLDELSSIGESDLVVLELSSFQLHWLRRDGWKPEIGVLTNITPNHLDWHGTFEAYVEDKCGIVPATGGTLVACADDDRVREIAARAPCNVVWASRGDVPAGEGVFWRDDVLVRRRDRVEAEVLGRADLRLLGVHAPINVACAASAAFAMGAGLDDVRAGVAGFEGLPHRLKPIGTVRGVLCVDDSKSTTPEATAGALAAFDRPVILLAGGYDKGLDPAPLVAAAAARSKAIVCYGATGPRLVEDLRAAGASRVASAATLHEAVDAAFGLADEGDVLLLSPGHASWDQFRNYEDRAAHFAEATARVAGWPAC